MINKQDFDVSKIIITGSGGVVGKPLLERFSSSGLEVIAINRSQHKVPDNVCFIEQDVSKEGCLDELLCKDSLVFHLAANASVPNSVKNPTYDFHHNTQTTFNILESIRKNGGRLIFPSSPSVFDRNSSLPLKEDSTIKPSSPYGASKVAGEAYCRAYHKSYGVDTRIARIFNVYGPGIDRFIIFDLINKLKENPNELEILGTGTQIRDYLFIDDLIESLLYIAFKGAPGEGYNVASGEGVKILDLARKITQSMGVPDLPIKPTGKSWPGDIPKWYGNIEKLKALGFERIVPFDKGLDKTVNWMLNSV